MGNKIICIGRQFGSGGHEAAVRLSECLGIRVYEKHLLQLACQFGEVDIKTLEASDEKATNPYLYRVVHEGNQYVSRGQPTSEVLFGLQSREIRRIASEENCIFVGRCANYVLRDTDARVLSVFISAPEEQRIKRKMEQENLSRQKAIRLIRKMDAQRKKYYEQYTGSSWGKADAYDLHLDMGKMDFQQAVDLLAEKYMVL